MSKGNRNLIVNYIPNAIGDHELHRLFSPHGELESARVIHDTVTGLPKGYGFVMFRHSEDAARAMAAMNGYEVYNKRLKVSCAKGPKPFTPQDDAGESSLEASMERSWNVTQGNEPTITSVPTWATGLEWSGNPSQGTVSYATAADRSPNITMLGSTAFERSGNSDGHWHSGAASPTTVPQAIDATIFPQPILFLPQVHPMHLPGPAMPLAQLGPHVSFPMQFSVAPMPAPMRLGTTRPLSTPGVAHWVPLNP